MIYKRYRGYGALLSALHHGQRLVARLKAVRIQPVRVDQGACDVALKQTQ